MEGERELLVRLEPDEARRLALLVRVLRIDAIRHGLRIAVGDREHLRPVQHLRDPVGQERLGLVRRDALDDRAHRDDRGVRLHADRRVTGRDDPLRDDRVHRDLHGRRDRRRLCGRLRGDHERDEENAESDRGKQALLKEREHLMTPSVDLRG